MAANAQDIANAGAHAYLPFHYQVNGQEVSTPWGVEEFIKTREEANQDMRRWAKGKPHKCIYVPAGRGYYYTRDGNKVDLTFREEGGCSHYLPLDFDAIVKAGEAAPYDENNNQISVLGILVDVLDDVPHDGYGEDQDPVSIFDDIFDPLLLANWHNGEMYRVSSVEEKERLIRDKTSNNIWCHNMVLPYFQFYMHHYLGWHPGGGQRLIPVPVPDIEKPLRHSLEEEVDSWDYNFFRKGLLNGNEEYNILLLELMLFCNSFNDKKLLNFLAACTADIMRGKNHDRIRQIFDLPQPTPEEATLLEEQMRWLVPENEL